MRKPLPLCILALGLALGLLAGCGGEAPSSSAPPASVASATPEPVLSDDPLLLAMRESLLAEGAVFRVDFVTLSKDKRVAIDAELLEGVAEALCIPEAEPVDGIRAIGDAEGELMLQGGDPWTGVYLYLLGEGSDPAGPATLLVLQVGEESANYLYGPEVFEAVTALVDARMVENTAVLEGEHLPLAPAQDTAIPQDCFVQAWAEANGVLAAAYHWYPSADSNATAGAVELFDASTGESLLVAQAEGGPERLEAGDWQGFDLRAILEGGGVLYINSQSFETKAEHPLPEALQARLNAPHTENRPYYFSFDQHPASGTAAVTDADGLHWQWAGGAGSLLNDDISTDMLSEERRDAMEEAPPEFSTLMLDDVRVMNGGNTLVATVVIPGSQLGITGLLALDLPTGEPHWYPGLYHLPMWRRFPSPTLSRWTRSRPARKPRRP